MWYTLTILESLCPSHTRSTDITDMNRDQEMFSLVPSLHYVSITQHEGEIDWRLLCVHEFLLCVSNSQNTGPNPSIIEKRKSRFLFSIKKELSKRGNLSSPIHFPLLISRILLNRCFPSSRMSTPVSSGTCGRSIRDDNLLISRHNPNTSCVWYQERVYILVVCVCTGLSLVTWHSSLFLGGQS